LDRSRGGIALIGLARAWGWIPILALGAACAAVVPSTRERLDALVIADGGPDAIVVAVDAESNDGAWGRVVRARTETPLDESKQLARVFDAHVGGPTRVVVGGPYPQLTEQVLVDAFSLVDATSLAQLRVVVVGPDPVTPRLRDACTRRDAVCTHQAWPTD
jgi:hypothetical protein